MIGEPEQYGGVGRAGIVGIKKMAKVMLIKSGGFLFGADAHSKEYIRKQPSGSHLELKVTRKHETRRDILNRLSHAIYNQAAKMIDGSEPDDEKAIAKLRHGIPILIHDPLDGVETQEYYRRMLQGVPYEERIDRMRENHRFYIPVTSIMRDDQMSKYIDRMIMDYAQRGVIITTNKDKELEAYDKYHEARKK